MALSLSGAQIEKLKNLIAAGRGSALSAPTNTDDASNPANLAARMQPIGSDARFDGVGIGVIEFTAAPPKVWVQNEDIAYRLASTAKLAILLSAMQLRADVRAVKKALGSIPAPVDDSFAEIIGIAGGAAFTGVGASGIFAPRISTIFDLTPTVPDFRGKDVITDIRDISWTETKSFSFWNRMTNAAAVSDNVSASSCASQIGVTYMKAVQRFYKLFDPSAGMRMLLGSGYGAPPRYAGKPPKKVSFPETGDAGAPVFRGFDAEEYQKVVDILPIKNKDGSVTNSTVSTQGGSASAITAYMLALVSNTLIDAESSKDIIKHLTPIDFEHACLTFDEIKTTTPLTGGFAKVGFLSGIHNEFAYVEAGGKKFGLLVVGLRGKRGLKKEAQGRALARAVFNAL